MDLEAQEYIQERVKVSPSGCWEWQKGKNNNGYGSAYWRGKPILAHRLAYAAFLVAPPKGSHICHTCDNPACVNPNHLWGGSRAENMKDMQRKGRATRGEKSSQSKLTETDVIDILSRLGGDENQKTLAKCFGVVPSVISNIKHGRRWAYLHNQLKSSEKNKSLTV